MKFDQDLCLNLRYELNPRVRCAFGNVFNMHGIYWVVSYDSSCPEVSEYVWQSGVGSLEN